MYACLAGNRAVNKNCRDLIRHSLFKSTLKAIVLERGNNKEINAERD